MERMILVRHITNETGGKSRIQIIRDVVRTTQQSYHTSSGEILKYRDGWHRIFENVKR